MYSFKIGGGGKVFLSENFQEFNTELREEVGQHLDMSVWILYISHQNMVQFPTCKSGKHLPTLCFKIISSHLDKYRDFDTFLKIYFFFSAFRYGPWLQGYQMISRESNSNSDNTSLWFY